VLQCVAVCIIGTHGPFYKPCSLTSVLQYVAVCCSVLKCVAVCCSALQCGAVCCSVLQCVIVNTHAPFCKTRPLTSVLQCVAVCCSMLQCVAVWCSVLQRGAVCCSVLQRVIINTHAPFCKTRLLTSVHANTIE